MTVQTYPGNMQTNPYAIYNLAVLVDGKEILTDQEGYIQNMDNWSKGFAEALAAREGLKLMAEHWDVIRFIRDYHDRHGVQAPVRDMIRHFSKLWGKERGNNRYLHTICPQRRPAKAGQPAGGDTADERRTLISNIT